MKKILCLLAILGIAAATGIPASPAPTWKFGIMADTQWRDNLDGKNPNTVAVGIIEQLNQRFIDAEVKFVIQVGDLADNGSVEGLESRAAAAQALYDAGIGFYPLRGNHDNNQANALRFQILFPQTTGKGPHVFGAGRFTSPFDTLRGLSYSFDYENARFVLLDQFIRTDGTNNQNSSHNILDQQSWIESTLKAKPSESHAFVFSHKNLIGQDHTDTLLGANPASNPDSQNAFYRSLRDSGVRYQISGHDHVHHRSIVTSPDKKASLQQIIAASNSYKFYIPKIPSNDEAYDLSAFGFFREIPIAQELATIGYYIVTVGGPRVTVDYFSSPSGTEGDRALAYTPVLTFTKRETFGYSLNGREFLIAQGNSYSIVQDSFSGTTMKILGGVNAGTATTHDGRHTIKVVDTGWAPGIGEVLASNILTLWGMADIGKDQTDVYTLAMSYDDARLPSGRAGSGIVGIASLDASGKWISAVEKNVGGNRRFVEGPWNPSYGLGTWGVDPGAKTAWAVINYNGDFAVARNLK